MLPPPESQASEETYAKFTADLKQRVVAMWEGLRNQRERTRPKVIGKHAIPYCLIRGLATEYSRSVKKFTRT